MSERRAMISAWQSLRASPRSLMYSPFIHLVPVVTQITWASITSVPDKIDNVIYPNRMFCFSWMRFQKYALCLPVVMTTPARTFRRACGDVKLSVSSLNLSTTKWETASARTWGTHNQKYANIWIMLTTVLICHLLKAATIHFMDTVNVTQREHMYPFENCWWSNAK